MAAYIINKPATAIRTPGSGNVQPIPSEVIDDHNNTNNLNNANNPNTLNNPNVINVTQGIATTAIQGIQTAITKPCKRGFEKVGIDCLAICHPNAKSGALSCKRKTTKRKNGKCPKGYKKGHLGGCTQTCPPNTVEVGFLCNRTSQRKS